MGVPAKLTERQIKFAELLVYNEGRMSPAECAKEAGYKTVLVPQASFVHIVAATTMERLAYFNSIVDRNREIFRRKWGEKLRRKLI